MANPSKSVKTISVQGGGPAWLEQGLAGHLSLYDREAREYRVGAVEVPAQIMADILGGDDARAEGVTGGTAWIRGVGQRLKLDCYLDFNRDVYVFGRGPDFQAKE